MNETMDTDSMRGLRDALSASPVLAADHAAAALLMDGLDRGLVGICLCDAEDMIRYVNAMFSATFFGDLSDRPANFVDALTHAMRMGRGIKLETMTIEAFSVRVKERRRTAQGPYKFSTDCLDGSWWLVNDHKLENGWMLIVACEISSIKDEEFRLRREHAAATETARTDFLTGIANRRYGYEKAEAALAAFRDDGLPVTVAILDIDHFKRVNDEFGHDVGDRVLVGVADHLKNAIGADDHLSRIGGEEFLIVMPSTSWDRAEYRISRLLDISLGAAPADPGLRVTLSAGLASAQPCETLTELMRRADAALYSAKSNGRWRLEVSRPERAREARRRN